MCDFYTWIEILTHIMKNVDFLCNIAAGFDLKNWDIFW